MRTIRVLLIAGFILVASACAEVQPSPTVEAPSLRFEPRITMFEEGKVHFEMGIANQRNSDQAAIDNADIRMVVTNQAGKIRNEMTIVHLGSISGNETITPLEYDGVYEPGRYVASLTSKVVPTLNLNFEIREENDVRILVAPVEFVDPHTEFTETGPDL